MSIKLSSIEEIREFDDASNRIIGSPVGMTNSYIDFRGEGNILFIEDGVRLDSCAITFFNDNSVIYISNSRHLIKVKADLRNDTVFFLGKDAYTNGILHVICSEQKHVIIGEDALFSFDIWFRNGDPHLIYDAESKKRTNVSKGIFLGDHVWIGQNVLVSKGTTIGSGAVVGAWSNTAGKRIPSNTIWGGHQS